MKRGTLLTLLILLILPLITAIEVTTTKDIYQPQETLQAEITGNFLTLISDNVFIYKDDKVHPEPVLKGLTKYNNIYYFYAVLPNQEGNFSLVIQDTEYFERGKIKTEQIKKEFKTEFKNTSDLSINPGFILTNEDFEINVKSLYKNTNLNAEFLASGEIKNVNLIEGLERTLEFSLPESAVQQSKVILNNYEVPVFIMGGQNPTIIPTSIEFIPYHIEGIVLTGGDYSFQIIIKNNGENNITNIEILTDMEALVLPSNIELLEPNSIEIINLTITIEETDLETLSGKLTAQSNDILFHLPILFNVTHNRSDVRVDDAVIDPRTQDYSCSQIGELCAIGKKCSGETTQSLEGPCCIGSCISKKSSNKTWIGVALIIVLILIVLYIIWKVRKRKKLKSPKEILKERSKNYEERMKPEQKDQEVSKSLDKI